MADAWGGSWGASWGLSWTTDGVTPPTPEPEIGGGGVGRRRGPGGTYSREKFRALMRSIREADERKARLRKKKQRDIAEEAIAEAKAAAEAYRNLDEPVDNIGERIAALQANLDAFTEAKRVETAVRNAQQAIVAAIQLQQAMEDEEEAAVLLLMMH